MLEKPTCLHIPPLYEEGTARIMWELADNADGYELDVHYDEDFETASTGKRWSDIDISNLSIGEIEDMNLTWGMIAKLPAQGWDWRNIEFHIPSWEQISNSQLSWADIQKLPVEFTEYKGAGEKTQGPDQGLTWSNINTSGLDWTQIKDLGWNWEDFMFQPSVGINWSQIKSENLNWAGIEANGKTWHEFERLAARGLGWGSLDGRFLDWSEIAAKQLTWQQFENLPADNKTHIAHVVNIPLYKKRAIFRMRAYSDDGECSEYLTSTLINTLPRSLAKYKPPCLHVPELYEGKSANIVWGDMYGASGYILEHKLGNKEFARVDGSEKQVPHPVNCKKPDELYYTPDCKQHLACPDQIPYYEKTAQYRIKGYNSTDSSQYLESAVVPIIPVFYRDDSISMSVTSGGKYLIQLHAKEIGDFENIIMTLKYDSLALQLEGFALEIPAGKTDTGGKAYAGNISEVSRMTGQICFRCSRQMKTDKEWNGLLVSVRFKALRTGNTDIALS